MSDPFAVGADELPGLLWSQLVDLVRRALGLDVEEPPRPEPPTLVDPDLPVFDRRRFEVVDGRVRCRRCRSDPATLDVIRLDHCLHDHCRPYLFPPYPTRINRTLSS